MSTAPLQILAGSNARARIETEGFHPGLFHTLLGASGGPKWFVLSRLDRVLATEFFAGPRSPIACLGSSIGSWRHACYAQTDPAAALARLEHCYIHQQYSDKPDRHEISRVARGCVEHILGEHGAQQIIDNPNWHTHILSVRSRWPVAHDATVPLALGLGACALGNAVSRRLLDGFFQRALFYSGDRSAVDFPDTAAELTRLSTANMHQAILSSGSIPLIMEGVRDIPGAPPGAYRDGGITDYHFDLRFQRPQGLILYPHFYRHITPGWYDKPLRWRRITGAALSDVVILSPTDEFVASLPYGKIPDRNDFQQLTEQQRITCWTRVCELSERIAETFAEAWQKGSLAQLVQPLP